MSIENQDTKPSMVFVVVTAFYLMRDKKLILREYFKNGERTVSKSTVYTISLYILVIYLVYINLR